jgi:peptidoglycan-associated lipoprotein
MKTMITTLAAILFGVGCSHTTPKTEAPPATITSAAQSTGHPPLHRQDVAESTPAENRANVADNAIYFDFDSAMIRSDARSALQKIGRAIAHSKKSVRIEGNCDERGTTEYNIALGDHRAREAQRYLERLGVPDRRISVVSYGSERPKYPGHDESAWAKNRRDDFKVQ